MLSLLAGAPGGSGNADGTGAGARFAHPTGVATDGDGNVYVADDANDTIRKITPEGVVSTFAGTPGMAGSTDGTGAVARFSGPQGVATDSAGNVYVADTGNLTIRKITPEGVVSTFAGTAGMEGSTDATGAAASFYGPTAVAVDGSGNVYVADVYCRSDTFASATIRKITPAGVVSTFAGTAGTTAPFICPQGVAVDSAGNVYVADGGSNFGPFDVTANLIRKITPAGAVTILAGAGTRGATDGVGTAASFNGPSGVGVDSAGNVYVADTGNDTIRKITPAGVVTTVVGRPQESGFLPGPLPGLLTAPYSVALFGTTLYTTTSNAIVQVADVP